MFWTKSKKPEPKPKPKPPRVAVHLTSGKTVVHYAWVRTIHPDGRLFLFDNPVGGGLVAEYVAGSWWSVTIGKRKVS